MEPVECWYGTTPDRETHPVLRAQFTVQAYKMDLISN